MSFFNKKKEEKVTPACACSSKAIEVNIDNSSTCCCGNKNASIHSIKVLGSGCKSCHALYENTLSAIKALSLNIEVEYITDLEKVVSYGVMSTPALVVNGKVVSMGKLLKPEDIEALLHKLGF